MTNNSSDKCTRTLSRRRFLAACPAASVSASLRATAPEVLLAVPEAGQDVQLNALNVFIAAHKKACEDSGFAEDALELAKANAEDCIITLLGGDCALGKGEHFALAAKSLAKFANIGPTVPEDELDALERQRYFEMERLNEAFSVENAAKQHWRVIFASEADALMTICVYRCRSLEELDHKFSYLWAFRDELRDKEYQTAILASLLPERSV